MAIARDFTTPQCMINLQRLRQRVLLSLHHPRQWVLLNLQHLRQCKACSVQE